MTAVGAERKEGHRLGSEETVTDAVTLLLHTPTEIHTGKLSKGQWCHGYTTKNEENNSTT